MNMNSILDEAHNLISKVIKTGDTVIDATVGNGHDTLFLAKAVGKSGTVFGFDIQDEAIRKTREKLSSSGENSQVKLIKDSHHHLDRYLSDSPSVKAAIFNLGYLPSGDKALTTCAPTTLKAIQALEKRMAPGGIIAIVFYPGHPEGKKEAQTIIPYLSSLDQKAWSVLSYRFINQIHEPPFLIAVEKDLPQKED